MKNKVLIMRAILFAIPCMTVTGIFGDKESIKLIREYFPITSASIDLLDPVEKTILGFKEEFDMTMENPEESIYKALLQYYAQYAPTLVKIMGQEAYVKNLKKLLVEAGIDITQPFFGSDITGENVTPLEFALENENLILAKLLLDKKAPITPYAVQLAEKLSSENKLGFELEQKLLPLTGPIR
jgi:hypothetical protein